MVNEEYLVKLSLLQEEAKKLEEQFQLINQELSNMEMLEKGIDEINEKSEVLFQIGRGVFVSNKQKGDKNKFFVNVGQGVVLKKGKEETKEIIKKQKEELKNVANSIIFQIENINSEIEKIAEEAEKTKQ